MSTKVSSIENLNKYLNNEKLTVVDFWATWCKPCLNIAPDYEKLALKKINVNFLKCDIADFEEDDLIEMELDKIPAIFVYSSGKKLVSFVGDKCIGSLYNYLDKNSVIYK